MKPRLLELLACPACKGNLDLRTDEVQDEETVTATLSCVPCLTPYPIVAGIPRPVARDGYVETFSDEWHRFRTVQMYSANGTQESEAGLALKTGLSPDDVRRRLVLDAGIGAGRYAEVVVLCGVEIVGVDLTRSIDAAGANLRGQSIVHLVQADIFVVPFRDETFEVGYSIGVRHHTPDTHPDWRWRWLDTFDWYTPRYQWKHRYPEVLRWFREAGFSDLHVADEPICVRGLKVLAQ